MVPRFISATARDVGDRDPSLHRSVTGEARVPGRSTTLAASARRRASDSRSDAIAISRQQPAIRRRRLGARRGHGRGRPPRPGALDQVAAARTRASSGRRRRQLEGLDQHFDGRAGPSRGRRTQRRRHPGCVGPIYAGGYAGWRRPCGHAGRTMRRRAGERRHLLGQRPASSSRSRSPNSRRKRNQVRPGSSDNHDAFASSAPAGSVPSWAARSAGRPAPLTWSSSEMRRSRSCTSAADVPASRPSGSRRPSGRCRRTP